MAVSFMPCLRTACRTRLANSACTLLSNHFSPKFEIRFTESVTCNRMTASKSSGTPSLDIRSSKWMPCCCGTIVT